MDTYIEERYAKQDERDTARRLSHRESRKRSRQEV